MDRGNHYEKAFEAYLRDRRLTYIAVDETRRSSFDDDQSIKSLDFIVHAKTGEKLLIDVKGRKFPYGDPGNKLRYVWKNWLEELDVQSLTSWEQQFGPGHRALVVFMYWLDPSVEMAPITEDIWPCLGRRYLLRAVPIADYQSFMRPLSPKWKTVYLPQGDYAEIVSPFCHFTHLPLVAAHE